MITQRWRAGLDFYRPAGEVIQTWQYEVAEIAADREAKAFVVGHHYSGSYPAARFRFGLYHAGALVGVAVFSHPCSDRVLTSVFPGPALEAVELGRFVLLDSVPGNGETWFLARCFEGLRSRGLRGVVSFSDPTPRSTADGRVLFAGHLGTIYQAHNACYLGRGAGQSLRLLPDARVFPHRLVTKIRNGERGRLYGIALLVDRYGAVPPAAGEDVKVWLERWLGRLTRRVRHAGCHKYAWSLCRRRRLVSVGGYPKLRDVLYTAGVT